MSYRRSGMGQAKIVPGQVNFLDPQASYEPFQTPGYIEHGSWVTGAPDVVAWSPPDRGGLWQRGGLGQLLTDFACSGSALNASWTTRTRDTLSAAGQAAVVAGVVAGVLGGVSKKPLLGAAAGGALSLLVFKVWTAPYSL